MATIMAASFALTACAGDNQPAPAPTPAEPAPTAEAPALTPEPEAAGTFAAGLVTDLSGVNDQSFNQSAWTGLQRLQSNIGANISYLESMTNADIGPNLDRMLDQNKDIIWAVSFLAADDIASQAMINPDQIYGIVDYNFGDDIAPNVVAVEFRDNENTFLAGYMAAVHSESKIIGFIGGMDIPVIERFEAGFVAGAEYAAANHGFEVEVLVQYIGDFSDTAIARGIATTMYTGGADVVFAAAGGAGQGLIDTAIEMDRYVIGVDMDQSHLAPEHMITSTLKLVGDTMYDVSRRLSEGESVGGQNINVGIVEGGVGISPFEGSTAALVDRAIFDSTMAASDRIANGTLIVPSDRVELAEFIANLG